MVRKDRFDDSVWASTLGTEKRDFGIYPAQFVRFTPKPPSVSLEQMIRTKSGGANYRFTGPEPTDFQMHYLKRSMGLLRSNGVPVILLRTPQWLDRHNNFITERLDWPKVFGMDMTLVSVPPSMLYQGLTDAEIDKMYYILDSAPRQYLHLNRNGNEYFTRVVAPAIVEAYAESVQRAD
jgi:hypothetical protein